MNPQGERERERENVPEKQAFHTQRMATQAKHAKRQTIQEKHVSCTLDTKQPVPFILFHATKRSPKDPAGRQTSTHHTERFDIFLLTAMPGVRTIMKPVHFATFLKDSVYFKVIPPGRVGKSSS